LTIQNVVLITGVSLRITIRYLLFLGYLGTANISAQFELALTIGLTFYFFGGAVANIKDGRHYFFFILIAISVFRRAS